MEEKKKDNHQAMKRILDRERGRNSSADRFNDRAHGRNEGQWPEWYRKARK